MKIKAALDFWGLFHTILLTCITSKTRTRTHNSKNVAKVIQRRIRINSFRKDVFIGWRMQAFKRKTDNIW